MSCQGIISSKKANNTLSYVLLKDRNLGLRSWQGPKINSWACLWVLPRPCHHAQCWLTNNCLIFLLIFWLETLKAGSRPMNFVAELPFAILSVVSFPHTPACPGTQYSPTACQVEIFNAFWHCWTNGDVLVAWRAFRAAWLLEQIRASLVYPEIEFHEHMPR